MYVRNGESGKEEEDKRRRRREEENYKIRMTIYTVCAFAKGEKQTFFDDVRKKYEIVNNPNSSNVARRT